MKTLTEDQAQELANLLGEYVCVDACGAVYIMPSSLREPTFFRQPEMGCIDRHNGFWHIEMVHDDECAGYDSRDIVGFYLGNIAIESSKPFNKQIWRPERE